MMKRLLAGLATIGIALAATGLVLALIELRPVAPPSQVGSVAGPSDSPAASQPEASPGCGVDEISADGPAPSISNRTRGSTVVVVATVVDVGSARWNTPDGSRPAFATLPPRGAYVYRPVTLKVTAPLKGSTPTSVTVRLPGGTADCFTFLVDGAPNLVVGHAYAFFLGPSRTASGADDTATLTVNEGWSMSQSGAVQTPLDGSLSIPALSAAVAAASS